MDNFTSRDVLTVGSADAVPRAVRSIFTESNHATSNEADANHRTKAYDVG